MEKNCYYKKQNQKMHLYFAIVCLLLFTVKSVYSAAITSSKITPVDLDYSCVRIITEIKNSDQSPILMFHGLTDHKSTWNGVYEVLALKTGRRVCIADLRNHGDSPWSNETSIAAMTEDAIHMLDSIGEKKGIIIGHSLGGKVAMHTALTYPERIEKIVVEDITPNKDPLSPIIGGLLKTMKDSMDAVPLGSDESQAKKIVIAHMRDLLSKLNITSEMDEDIPISPIICTDGKCRFKMNIDAFLDAFVYNFSDFWTPSTGIYKQPALFIYGAKSDFKVGEDEEIPKLFPEAKLVAVEGAHHVIHGLFKEFIDETLKFLNSS